jgi:hypothetical protein
MRTILLLFLSIMSSVVIAADWKPLEGAYALTPEAHLTPPTPEPEEMHFRFHLTGDTARDLYHAVNAEEMIDECSVGKAKQLSNIKCLYFKKEDQYECRFSINLTDNTIADQSTTC